MPTRRVFLRNAAMPLVGIGTAPLWLQRAAFGGQPSGRKKVLVAIFLRGAADGLNMVVPFGDAAYYRYRPTIAVPAPGRGNQDAAIDLDGKFGLHPSLAPLADLYREGRMSIVQAAGSPDPTRSHFDAQDYMESGTPGRKSTADGWMNRALAPGGPSPSPVRAVAMGGGLPRSLVGRNPAVAIRDLEQFRVQARPAAASFESMYARSVDTILHGAGRETFDAVELLGSIDKAGGSGNARYPRGRFGESLRQIAQLIRADAGVEVAFTDIGGWDHHVNEAGQRATQGQLAQRLAELSRGLAAFWTDLGKRQEDTVIVTMSEFGRTAKENGNRGTDHGHGNCMFVLGGPVKGGRIVGRWPGLETEQLYEGRDLAVTTDFREVLGELVADHMGNRDLSAVFPGYRMGAGMGLLG